MRINNKYHLPREEISFVNIELSKDNLYFLDPYRIYQGEDELSKECKKIIEEYMKQLLEVTKARCKKKADELTKYLIERNETRLGYSHHHIKGKSMGKGGGKDFVQLLVENKQTMDGLIEDIFDCAIMIDNVGEDKVSDLLTSLLSIPLIRYTQEECNMWKIPMKNVILKKKNWDAEKKIWVTLETSLPIYNKMPIILVPKKFVSRNYVFSYKTFYRDVIIPEYKKRELSNPNSDILIHYKNGRIQVNTKILKKRYPCTKYVALDFVKRNDILYREYKKERLKELKKEGEE